MPNSFTLPTFDNEDFPWIYHTEKNTFGKRSKIKGETITYRHWVLNPLTLGKLSKCRNCPETPVGKHTCYITTTVSTITNIQVDQKKTIHADILDLQTARRIRDQLQPLALYHYLSYKDIISKCIIDATTNLSAHLWTIYQKLFTYPKKITANVFNHGNHNVLSSL